MSPTKVKGMIVNLLAPSFSPREWTGQRQDGVNGIRGRLVCMSMLARGQRTRNLMALPEGCYAKAI